MNICKLHETNFVIVVVVGIWKDKSELVSIRRTERLFEPQPDQMDQVKGFYRDWLKALERSKEWYATGKS